VNFGQKFTEDGDYTYMIPANLFTMDGVPNDEFTIDVTLFTFTIIPLEVVSVTPVEGTVDQIDKIVIEFNQNITLSFNENWQQISREITLKGDKQDYILTYAPSGYGVSNKLEYLVNAKWNGYDAYDYTPILDEGTYTLDLKEIVVDHAAEDYVDDWGYQNTKWHAKNVSVDKTCTWTIEASTGIDRVAAEKAVKGIYDITGRKIEKITEAGIYIMDGKKILVK
jgi:hypothetical protein